MERAGRADLESLLTALARDPGLARQLDVDPASVLAVFDLTDDELALLDRSRRPVDGPRLDQLFTRPEPSAPHSKENP